MEKCAQCASHSNLRRCTGCLEVWYCSTECQKCHWGQHKTACRKPSSSKRETKEDKRDAAGRTRKAAKKRPVEYSAGETPQDSSVERERSQDKVTDEVCETTQSNDDGTLAEGATGGVSDKDDDEGKKMTCKNCGNSARHLKKCGRCKEVAYCSRDCQRADWPTHKVTCTSPDAIVIDGFRQMQEQEHEAERSASRALHDFNFMTHLLHNLHTTYPGTTWAEARSRASRLLPGQPMVERFQQLPGGMFRSPLFAFGPVLLCRITRPYFHPFRHARYVEDVDGNELYVIFYNEEPPWPYFQYLQLREGNFLCFIDAHIHYFVDGSVGFRIDDPADVRIIE